MALVDYASSDEDEAKIVTAVDLNAGGKRKRDDELPPLPSRFHDLYASTTRVSTRDDPSLHGGRKRVSPHIDGNWPTHLYIEWYPSTAEHGLLSKLISTLKDAISMEGSDLNSFMTSDLEAPLPLHISLSRPIGFATEQKDEFLGSLEHAIKSSGIRPFDVLFSSIHWVPNFEKTRWFLVLGLKVPDKNELNKLLHVCNATVQACGQPPLYAEATERKSPRKYRGRGGSMNNIDRSRSGQKPDWSSIPDLSSAFHISIAWRLKPPSENLLEATKSLNSGPLEVVKNITVKVEEIKAKIGNAVTSIRLQKSVGEGKGLFGF